MVDILWNWSGGQHPDGWSFWLFLKQGKFVRFLCARVCCVGKTSLFLLTISYYLGFWVLKLREIPYPILGVYTLLYVWQTIMGFIIFHHLGYLPLGHSQKSDELTPIQKWSTFPSKKKSSHDGCLNPQWNIAWHPRWMTFPVDFPSRLSQSFKDSQFGMTEHESNVQCLPIWNIINHHQISLELFLVLEFLSHPYPTLIPLVHINPIFYRNAFLIHAVLTKPEKTRPPWRWANGLKKQRRANGSAGQCEEAYGTVWNQYWMVVWNIFYFPTYWE